MADKNVKQKHQGWVASLSNGETVFEGPTKKGERTAWGQLIERCENDPDLYVTQLQLQVGGKTFVGIKNADGYCYFIDYRAEGIMNLSPGQPMRQERHLGIGSVIGQMVYCTKINDQGQSWQDTRPLSKMRLHCILKPAGQPASQPSLQELAAVRKAGSGGGKG